MINTIKEKIEKLLLRIKLSKINYLNHKFKKYIVKYEEKKDKIKIYNSNGDYKIIDNTIPNKVKVMEIIKEHKIEIEEKIEKYENKKDDNLIILLSTAFLLIVLGFVFIFSFFVGSYLFLLLSLISFSITLVLFSINTYKIYLFREEIKRLKLIKDNKDIFNNNEIKEMILDSLIIIKDKIYSIILKVFQILDNKKVKS